MTETAPAAGLALDYAMNATQATTLITWEHAPYQAAPSSLALEDHAPSADYTTTPIKKTPTDALHVIMDATYATKEILVNALNASQSTTLIMENAPVTLEKRSMDHASVTRTSISLTPLDHKLNAYHVTTATEMSQIVEPLYAHNTCTTQTELAAA